ncbi:MAG TPA: hypothetical protein PKW75_11695 [candidate division Zixibacteria bacterium]|nr:hypothetical protein [candidate division Zixibacteria bacterium]MDD4916252.1 hypothetical protein [candidate division Zixibacteria bacterium]MDM7973150.1 hypothetical protein [candidate division Zixibacteria bacterium]HOD67522.1 hypothetical protein [candidate division Zixibacteria bacterium]HOZ08940.1 hypothetical protein [candidate division Zixibacteria bacterium]
MILALVAVLALAVAGNRFVSLPDSVTLPAPGGWRVLGEPASYPAVLHNEASGARLLVFETRLDPGERIGGAADFQVSVSRMIDSVVLQMPNAVLLTSTGQQAENRAEFAVEFQTIDTATGAAVYHRLAGILYRHPDGSQLLFSLWAQAPPGADAALRAELERMQSGFRYNGPQEAQVFAPARSDMQWFLVFLIGAAAVVLFLRQRRRLARAAPEPPRAP